MNFLLEQVRVALPVSHVPSCFDANCFADGLLIALINALFSLPRESKRRDTKTKTCFVAGRGRRRGRGETRSNISIVLLAGLALELCGNLQIWQGFAVQCNLVSHAPVFSAVDIPCPAKGI